MPEALSFFRLVCSTHPEEAEAFEANFGSLALVGRSVAFFVGAFQKSREKIALHGMPRRGALQVGCSNTDCNIVVPSSVKHKAMRQIPHVVHLINSTAELFRLEYDSAGYILMNNDGLDQK